MQNTKNIITLGLKINERRRTKRMLELEEITERINSQSNLFPYDWEKDKEEINHV